MIVKTILTIIFPIFLGFSCFSQLDSEIDSLKEESVIPFLSCQQSFPGGYLALELFISERIFYPEALNNVILDNSKLYLSFQIDSVGFPVDIKIFRSVQFEFDRICVDLIQQMPCWIPCENAVDNQILFPITVCLK